MNQILDDCSGKILWIIGASALSTALLRTIISKDNFAKVAMLGFSLSCITYLNCYYGINLRSHIWLFNISVWVYLIVLNAYIWGDRILKALRTKSIQLIPKLKQGNQSIQINKKGVYPYELNKQKWSNLVYLSIAFILGLSLYYLHLIFQQFWKVVVQSKLLFCCVIIFASLVVIHLMKKGMQSFMNEEEIIRKLFHIGPIIVAPLVHYISPYIEVLILTGAFFVFFLLQIVRYSVTQLNILSAKYAQQKKLNNNKLIYYLSMFFQWMKSFNSREKYFWFTHLFLIMSLQLSYTLELITQMNGSGHIILCLVAADGMAAFIGKKIGKYKIYQKKTLEGSITFAITFIFTYKIIQTSYHLPVKSYAQLLLSSVLCSAAELISGDADNISTLLAYYGVSYSIN